MIRTQETMRDVSAIVARRLQRVLPSNHTLGDLDERVLDLATTTYDDISKARSATILSWSRQDELTDSDQLICVMDRVMNLSTCGFYHAHSRDSTLRVLGFWEFHDTH